MSHKSTSLPLVSRLVAQATLLFERLEQIAGAQALPVQPAAPPANWEAWEGAVSTEDAPLARYWAWMGIAPEHVAQLSHVTGDAAPLPHWAVLLAETLHTSQTADDSDEAHLNKSSYPFSDLWVPFIRTIRQRLAPHALHLAPSGLHSAENTLLERLSQLAAETVYGEFEAYRKQSLGRLAAFIKPHSTDLYQRFIAQMQMTPSQAPLLGKYPVLARLIANRCYWWSESQAECLQRLNADWSTLVQQFADGQDQGAVVALKMGVSDYHRGGRGAIILTFESGLRLVYKPKPLGMEAAYNQLLAWLNAHHAPLELKPLRVLDCGAYGWVEFADHLPLPDAAAAERYYQRIGALGCLMYLLLGTDCHHENLIASGEYPVLVDQETLFSHAIFRHVSSSDASSQAQQLIHRSVLASLLFPEWLLAQGQEARPFDLSGIGALEAQQVPATDLAWREINTDRMKMTDEALIIQPDKNVPWLGGKIAAPEQYTEAILAGFQATYRYFMAQKALMTSPDSPLMRFKGQQGRFLVRHSNDYSTLLMSARHPVFLKDGLAYGIHLEHLARFYPMSQYDATHRRILQAERQAIMRGDIPLFVARVDRCALFTEDDEIITEDYFTKSSFDYALERMSNLEEGDLVWQLRLIRFAIVSRSPQHAQASPYLVGEPATAALSQQDFLEEAAQIGRLLEGQAIWGQDGSVTWLSAVLNEAAQRHRLEPISLSLYNGQAGVALFLAQASRFHLWEGAQALCNASLQPIRAALASPTLDIQQLGLGAGFGLGGWLYVLTRAGQWLHDDALIEEARQGARRLSPAIIESDRRLDVLEGSAGLLLSLLAVYEATHDAEVLAHAQLCGRHLLAHQRLSPQEGAGGAWDTMGDGMQWGGFSHGVAGIAYPLMRLYGVTGQSEFRQAAETAIAYENTTYEPQEGNWRRVFSEAFIAEHGDSISWFWASWCHGAPGIGLSRAASLPWLDTPAMRQDIAQALSVTQRAFQSIPTPNRFLCCGDMGRIESLFTMARFSGQPELEDLARQHASKLIQQATDPDGYRSALGQAAYQVYAPGLFVGICGVGYQLLRLAHPKQVASVLLWE